jgi:type VI secretion system protein ImpK
MWIMRLIDCYAEILTYTEYLLKQRPVGSSDYETVFKQFQKLITRSQHLGESNDFSSKMWRDGFFAVSAWIDERILCSDWAGRDTWQRNQLQRFYYKTTTAGRDFFDRLEHLADTEIEVREVYEYCLALGFRGMYFHPVDHRKLEEIQMTNLQALTDNLDLEVPDELFPVAYQPKEGESTKRRSKWKKTLGFPTGALIVSLIIIFSTYFIFKYVLDNLLLRHFGVE